MSIFDKSLKNSENQSLSSNKDKNLIVKNSTTKKNEIENTEKLEERSTSNKGILLPQVS